MSDDDPATDPVSRGGTSTVRSDGARLATGSWDNTVKLWDGTPRSDGAAGRSAADAGLPGSIGVGQTLAGEGPAGH